METPQLGLKNYVRAWLAGAWVLTATCFRDWDALMLTVPSEDTCSWLEANRVLLAFLVMLTRIFECHKLFNYTCKLRFASRELFYVRFWALPAPLTSAVPIVRWLAHRKTQMFTLKIIIPAILAIDACDGWTTFWLTTKIYLNFEGQHVRLRDLKEVLQPTIKKKIKVEHKFKFLCPISLPRSQ